MTYIYTPQDYNDDGVLKIPTLLIGTSLYLAKYLFLGVMPGLPIVGKGFDSVADMLEFDAWLLMSSLPSALVLFSMVRRSPKGKAVPRWIWRHGQFLLAAGAILELMLLIAYVLLERRTLDEVILAFGYIDMMILVYLVRSQWVRDVFAEFPELKKRPEKTTPGDSSAKKGDKEQP